jgi:hypothetical protein
VAAQTVTDAKETVMKTFSDPSRLLLQGNSRIPAMILVLAIGFAGGALVVYQSTKAKPPPPIQADGVVLSESTRSVLKKLRAPVAVRFYSLSGAEPVPEDLRNLTARVN